jgi:hypothetical protein
MKPDADGKYRLRFKPPTKPWSSNDERNKMHRMERVRRVREWRSAAAEAAREAGLGRLEGKVIVQIHVPFPIRRTRDPHNMCSTALKSSVDGLVDAGVIPDDDPEHLGHREPVLYIDKDPDAEVVLVIELE